MSKMNGLDQNGPWDPYINEDNDTFEASFQLPPAKSSGSNLTHINHYIFDERNISVHQHKNKLTLDHNDVYKRCS